MLSTNPCLIRYLLQYPRLCYSYCEIYELYHIIDNQIYASTEYLVICYSYHEIHDYRIVLTQLNDDILLRARA